jgi:uncharacterized protein (DUF1330 family)
MPAYWVARSRIIDPVQYKKYTDLVPASSRNGAGRSWRAGGAFEIMEGPTDSTASS